MYPVHATRAWKVKRPCGLMDKALVFGTKDCKFESCQGHFCEDEHVRRTYVSMSDAYSVCIWCGLVCSCSCALFRHVGVCSLQQTHTASMNPTRSTKRRRQRRESNPLRAEPNEFPIRHLNCLVTRHPCIWTSLGRKVTSNNRLSCEPCGMRTLFDSRSIMAKCPLRGSDPQSSD